MEKKFIVPASAMLSGIIAWVVLLVIHPEEVFSFWPEVILSLISGILICFSAYSCRKAGGPRGGNVFRVILLLVFAVLSYFFIGTASWVIMLAAGIFTGLFISAPQELRTVSSSR